MLAAHPDIIGPPACRRLSLDPLAAAAAAASAAKLANQPRRGAAGAGGGGGGSSSGARGSYTGGPGRAPRATCEGSLGGAPVEVAASAGSYRAPEVNPLRRLSLPMSGAPPRGLPSDFRRGSMPVAPPTAAASPLSAAT